MQDYSLLENFPKRLQDTFCFGEGKYNILISGATNSGKSSLLNALAEYIGQEERVITIEDSAELQLFHVDNLVRLETRNANVEGANEITMQDLIKASFANASDRIIVGEVRGAEAMSMLQALSTGHSGSFSSIHANSCRDALRRLETMVYGNGYAAWSNSGFDCFFCRYSYTFGKMPERREKDIRDK